MANEEHLKILRQGVEVWNRWREENPDVRPDLSGAHLSGPDLREVDLREVDLREADLSRASLSAVNLNWANLSRADLSRAELSEVDLSGARLIEAGLREADFFLADLSRADLSRADLSWARLSEVDLSGARLIEADLFGAKLSEARLSGAYLSNASVSATVFAGIDLSVAKGLETIVHRGPSYIDIHTIYRSGGKIPEAFLRGAGVPDNFITYIASLTGKAFEYYSCFISYSTNDDRFAKRLHNDLQGEGVRCWFAPDDMKIGDDIWDRIDKTIRIHDKLLVVLSEHSISSSWVKDEVQTAFEEERQCDRTILIPIRLDDSVMKTDKPWVTKIRRRHIGDFTKWEQDRSYQEAFTRLLRDLKASEA
jgi:hypothetical protein